MKDVSDVTFCVVDTGLFLPLAFCLSQQAKRVIYWNTDKRSFPSVKQGTIGDGFENIEQYWGLYPPKDADCYVFPDIGNADLQEDLIERGRKVWGSGGGDILELDREHFMEVIKEVGLDVPKFEVVVGWTALSKHLIDQEDKYIKISRFRGDMETTHWRSWAQDEQWLYWLAIQFGSVKERIRFLVFDAIDTDLEIGADTYCVDGNWPALMLNGFEAKDTTYFSAVTKRSDMPEQINDVLEAFGPELRHHSYRNQWSMEVRVKGDEAYFIDATCRGGMPSSGSQQLIWSNFPDIIWHGANGQLLEPEPAAKFSIECMICSKTGKDLWDEVEIDPSIERNVRFSSCALVDGKYCFPPDEFHEGELGWLVALGDTPSETLKNAKDIADKLPDGLDAKLENLTALIQEIESAQELGIPFTDQKVPDAAEVIND